MGSTTVARLLERNVGKRLGITLCDERALRRTLAEGFLNILSIAGCDSREFERFNLVVAKVSLASYLESSYLGTLPIMIIDIKKILRSAFTGSSGLI